MKRSSDRYFRKVAQTSNHNIMSAGISIPAGVYFGIVVDNVDPDKRHRIKVHIGSLYSALMPPGSEGSDPGDLYIGSVWCERLMPYGGFGFGLMGPAPRLNDEVLVAFSGDTDRGVVLGVFPDVKGNGNVSGPVSRQTSEGRIVPSNEPSVSADNPEEPPEPHPITSDIESQGLIDDTVRGQNLSDINRDSTPRVVGISSPLGHSFVMDDGSDEEDSFNLVRLRTSGGAQILLDDNNGFIYIINRSGSGWVEINRNGDFDIFSGGNVNIHTTGEFNVHAGGNINMQADRNINLKSVGAEGVKIEASRGSLDFHAHANANITADTNGNLRIAGNLRMSAGRIDLNGPPALAAAKPSISQLGENTSVTESIAGRVPEREPWRGHLDQPRFSTSGNSGGGATSPASASPAQPSGTQGARPSNNFAVADETLGNGLIFWKRSLVPAERKVNPELLTKFENIIKEYGRPVIITEGFRITNNRGVKNSLHFSGNAIDFKNRDGTPFSKTQVEKLVELASKNGIKGIGVYSFPENNVNTSVQAGYLHFDIRQGNKESWGLLIVGGNKQYLGEHIPVFARPVLSRFGYN